MKQNNAQLEEQFYLRVLDFKFYASLEDQRKGSEHFGENF